MDGTIAEFSSPPGDIYFSIGEIISDEKRLEKVLVPSRGYLFLNEVVRMSKFIKAVLVPSRGYLFLNKKYLAIWDKTVESSRPLSGISISQYVLMKYVKESLLCSRPLSGISISQY